jgi:hypothetical protein
MEQLIRVELKDGSVCRMVVKAFNLFLAQNQIRRFERAEGWVTVGVDMLRGMTSCRSYEGPERRATVRTVATMAETERAAC